jgi:hypothetical protein
MLDPDPDEMSADPQPWKKVYKYTFNFNNPPLRCVPRELPDRVLNFMRSHPLMDGDVNHEGGAPVFYKRDVVFTHLAVDRLATGHPLQAHEK